MSTYFSYKHMVGFEETNVVGNVYFANFLKWQGHCREMFLKSHCPTILNDINNGLSLVTMNVRADFFHELFAFDEVEIRLHLSEQIQNRVKMKFEYWKVNSNAEPEQLVAISEQQIATMRKENGRLVATPLPVELVEALNQYTLE